MLRSMVRLFCRPEIVGEDYSRLFRSLGQICALDVHVGQTDVLTIGHSPGMDMKIATEYPRLDATPGDRCPSDLHMTTSSGFPRTDATPGERCAVDLVTTVQIVRVRTSSNPGVIGAVKLVCRTVRSFPQIDSTADDCGVAELDFRRTSFPPDEFSAGRECDYIWLAPLAGSSVCARTVTGSRLFGSPHRLVRSCLCSAVLSLRWIDGRVISKESTDIPQSHHLETIVGRSTPDICSLVWTVSVGIYLLPLSFARFLIICCCLYRIFKTRDMASGRSPERDQAGPSYAPSDPLPGTFLGLSLDIISEKLYDLAPDIPDVMGLRALRPSAAVVKVMSVPDSRCILVVTPDDHVECGFHEILLHDMGEEELPFVATSELDSLRRIWPRALFAFMIRY